MCITLPVTALLSLHTHAVWPGCRGGSKHLLCTVPTPSLRKEVAMGTPNTNYFPAMTEAGHRQCPRYPCLYLWHAVGCLLFQVSYLAVVVGRRDVWKNSFCLGGTPWVNYCLPTQGTALDGAGLATMVVVVGQCCTHYSATAFTVSQLGLKPARLSPAS